MDRLTGQQLHRLLDFLRAGYACHEQEAFVTHLLGGIPTLIRSEVTTYNVLDPQNNKVVNAMIEPASVLFPGAAQLFEQHLIEHPIITYYRQTRDTRAVKISDFLSRTQYHRLGLYQGFFRQVGVEYQMVALFTPSAPLMIGIGLNRSRRDFSERDRLLLNLLRPHLARTYANVQAFTAIRQEASRARLAMEASGQEMVVLTKEGQAQQLSPRAHRWLATYFGPIKAGQLPEPLQAWLRHQEAALGRADDVPPPRTPLQVRRDGTCLQVRHLCEGEQCLLLLEERQTSNVPATFERDGLTRREAEVLHWMAEGKTNTEIGCILGISPRTVEKHLEHIYTKLGVERRLAAATVALGWGSGA